MTLTAGVIGLGRIGFGFESDRLRVRPCTHVGVWTRTQGVQLAGVQDLDRNLSMFVASTYRTASYENYTELGYACDIVSVATPAETHKEVVLKLVDAKRRLGNMKLKLLWCEKPLAKTVSDAQLMVDACKEAGVILAVDHTRRWDPTFRRVKEVIDSDKYGHVVRAEVAYSGDLLEVGSHMMDLLNWYGLEDYSLVQLSVPYLVFELKIFCEKGVIAIPDNGMGVFEYEVGESDRYTEVLEPHLAKVDLVHTNERDYRTPMALAAAQLRDCVLKGEKPFCTGQDGLNALRMQVGC